MATTPENRVKAKVRDWLKAKGYYYFMPSQNGRGVVGVPDFVVCANGRFVGIETKAPGRKADTTAPQKLQLAGINKAGGVAVVVDSTDDLTLLEMELGRPEIQP